MSDHSLSSTARVNSPSAGRDPFDLSWHAYVDGKAHGPYTGHELRKMAANGEIIETDLVAVSGGSSWVQAKDDPVLRLLFIRTDRVSKPSSSYTAKRGRHINRIATLVILFGLVWLVWPYYAVYDLARGFRNGDEATLQNRVNWDSVRQGLRGDLNASFLKNASKEQSDLGRGFALMLGPTFINQMVDGYVTPQAIGRLVRDGRPKDPSNNDDPTNTLPSGAEVQQTIRKFSVKQVEYAFFSGSPFGFKVDIRSPNPETSGVVALYFKWSGDWTLTQVSLPWDEIERLRTKSD